jgi:hypothetical protein
LERESYRDDQTIVAVRFFRREVFKALGMFDESLVAGEDFDIHNRLVAQGYRWSHVDAIENHIGEPKTLREVWGKFYYYGRTIKRYRQKNQAIAKKQLVIFRPSYRKIIRDVKQQGLLTPFVVYHFTKYFAGAVGMLVGPPASLKQPPAKKAKRARRARR